MDGPGWRLMADLLLILGAAAIAVVSLVTLLCALWKTTVVLL